MQKKLTIMLGIELHEVAFDTRLNAKPAQIMERKEIISRNPDIMNGALVFAGTRVSVEILVQHLTAGDSLETFLDNFPSVSRAQAIAYLEMTLQHVGMIA